MLRTEPRFVSPEDYYNYWGVDLNLKLKGDDNQSNKANIFLLGVENRLLTWIDANTFRVIKWDEIQGEQLEHLQIAILLQAKYVYNNTDIGMDSGYDPENGIVASKAELSEIEICQPAIDEIKTAGLYNRRIYNRRRFTNFN